MKPGMNSQFVDCHLLRRNSFLLNNSWLNMRGIPLIAFVCLLTGCAHIISEPYPAFTYGALPKSELPESVVTSFESAHPDAHITRVETESFKGQIGQYRIWYLSGKGQAGSAVFDRDGRPVASPGFFRPAPDSAANTY